MEAEESSRILKDPQRASDDLQDQPAPLSLHPGLDSTTARLPNISQHSGRAARSSLPTFPRLRFASAAAASAERFHQRKQESTPPSQGGERNGSSLSEVFWLRWNVGLIQMRMTDDHHAGLLTMVLNMSRKSTFVNLSGLLGTTSRRV